MNKVTQTIFLHLVNLETIATIHRKEEIDASSAEILHAG